MTKYGIYIIESLRENDYFEGENLCEILKYSLVESKYKFVESKDDFERAINDFNKSNFRYLYISCHADENGFEINGDEITNIEFMQITKNCLINKRIFLSACKGANDQLASYLITQNKAYSLIGVPANIDVDKSALFWPLFFHVINEVDDEKMKRKSIVSVIKKLVKLLNIPISYYSKIKKKDHLRRLNITNYEIKNEEIKAIQ